MADLSPVMLSGDNRIVRGVLGCWSGSTLMNGFVACLGRYIPPHGGRSFLRNFTPSRIWVTVRQNDQGRVRR